MVGSSPLSGNEFITSSHPFKLTLKNLREVSVDRPHCIQFSMNFLQEHMHKEFNLDGNVPSGYDSNPKP